VWIGLVQIIEEQYQRACRSGSTKEQEDRLHKLKRGPGRWSMTEWWWQCLEREHAVRLELLQQVMPGAERSHDAPFNAGAGGEACAGGSYLFPNAVASDVLPMPGSPLIKTSVPLPRHAFSRQRRNISSSPARPTSSLPSAAR
jgi:hypothetical protein